LPSFSPAAGRLKLNFGGNNYLHGSKVRTN